MYVWVSTVIHHIDHILQTAVHLGVEKLFLCGVFLPFLPSPQQLQHLRFRFLTWTLEAMFKKTSEPKIRKCQRNKMTMDKSIELQEVFVSDRNIESGHSCSVIQGVLKKG